MRTACPMYRRVQRLGCVHLPIVLIGIPVLEAIAVGCG